MSSNKLLLLPVILLLLSSSFLVVNLANGMGPPPTACNNLYGGKFTAFRLTLENGTSFDLMAHPNITIIMPNIDPYNVTYTVHLNARSVNNNTATGDVWLWNDAEYRQGYCSHNLGMPSADITLNFTVTTTSFSGPGAPAYTQYVQWLVATTNSSGFQRASQVGYTAIWPAQNTTMSTTTTTTTTTTSTSVSSTTTSYTSTSSGALTTINDIFLTPALSLVSLAMFVLSLIFRYFLGL